MSRTVPVLPMLALFTILVAPAAVAQPALDKRIGLNEFAAPVVITTIEPPLIGTVARAAGVPMGIEVAPGAPPRRRRER